MARKLTYLYGRNSVAERIYVNPGSIKQIFIQENFNLPSLVAAAKEAAVPISNLSQRELSQLKKADNLQGIVALVEQFQYTEWEDLLTERDKLPCLLFLDRIYDPQNLGAIIRTAACFGGFAVVIPKHNACEVTETVLHVASGGENHLPVVQVVNLAQAIIWAKEKGYWITGTVTSGGEDITRISFPFPLGVVIGSEGSGIRYGIEKHLDLKTTIPMPGAALSFNVTVATALFCYEVIRQKNRL